MDNNKTAYQKMIKEVDNEIRKLLLKKKAYELAINGLNQGKTSNKSSNKAGQSSKNKAEYKYICDDCGQRNITENIRAYCLKNNRYGGNYGIQINKQC